MKLSKIVDQIVYVENEKIGQVKDVYVDCETWEVSHFEVQLTKEAAREILGFGSRKCWRPHQVNYQTNALQEKSPGRCDG